MNHSRRQVLATTAATIGSIGLTGCSGILGGLSGPNYETDQKEEMLLSIDSFPDGWVRNDEINDNFDAGYTSEDESIVVLMSVEVSEEVSGAEDRFKTAKSGMSEPNDYELADEAFWATRNEEVASTLFRHSNAVGQSLGLRESGIDVVPDQSRSQDYARKMFSHWQDM